MKNFMEYIPEKYAGPAYRNIEDGIYKTQNPYGSVGEEVYVTSLSFEQEPELYGEEDGSPQNITQVPFEDLLDEYMVFVSDFYEDRNRKSKDVCYGEFGSALLENVRRLRGMIGKRIYAVPYVQDGQECYRTVIE